MITQEYVIENQQLQLVINQLIDDQEVSTLLKLFFLVQASDVLGLETFILDYLKESNILARLEALENGESGLLVENPHEMDFLSFGNLNVIRGNYDEENMRFYC